MTRVEPDSQGERDPAAELERIRAELEPLVVQAEEELMRENLAELESREMRVRILELSMRYLELEIEAAGGYEKWHEAGGPSELADRAGAALGNYDCVRRLWKKRPDLGYLKNTRWYQKFRLIEENEDS